MTESKLKSHHEAKPFISLEPSLISWASNTAILAHPCHSVTQMQKVIFSV